MNQKRQKRCVLFLLLAGALVRLYPWIQNRALWFDEALLANNLIGRSFFELTLPMTNNQSAPIAYLWLTKFFSLFLGTSEWVLRLPSLIAGLLSLYLFYLLAKKLFHGWWICWALAFFAFCDPHTYYSSEFKQYAFDVCFTLSITLACLPLFQREWKTKSLIRLGILGVVAVWFSQPVIFVLAGAGLGLLAFHWQHFSRVMSLGLWGGLWLLSFGSYYFLFLNNDVGNDHLQLYHQAYFMPLSFWKAESWSWYIESWFGFFRFPGGILFKYPAGGIALLGLLFVPRWWKSHWLLLFFPLLLAIFASGLQLYSTLSRLLLFAAPALIIMLIQGLRHIEGFLEGRNQASWSKYFLGFLTAILLLQPVLNSIQRFTTPNEVNEIKPVLKLIQENHKKGEIIYLNPGAVPQFDYYKHRYGLEDVSVIRGHAIWEDWKKDLDLLIHHPAAWCLFSHDKRDGTNDQQIMRPFFEKHGLISNELRTINSGIFLFTLPK